MVHPDRDEIVRGEVRARLEPRSMRVLVHLVARAGEVVGVGELLDVVWKDVVVTQDSVYTTITALRRALGDSAESPRYIATVPRRGYRLVAPVRPLAPEPPVPAVPAVPAQVQVAGHRGRLLAAGLLAALVLAAALAWGWRRLHAPATAVPAAAVAVPTGAPAGAERNSVAVLPFLDLSPGHDQGYFADGMAEELIDHLARIPGLLVTARTSSFYFRDKPSDLPSIAAKLNVRNLVEGSVRRDRNRVRITVQLVRAADGYHLWSQTYERPLADVFAVQDEVASALARSLDVTFKSSDSAEEGGTANPEAYDHFLKSRNAHNRGQWGSSLKEARVAVAIDPGYARAWASVAFGCYHHVPMPDCDASAAIDKALELAPRMVIAHTYRALFAMDAFDFDRARREIDVALQIGTDPASVLNARGNLAFRLGDYRTAMTAAREGIRRNPLGSGNYGVLVSSYFGACDYPGALAESDAALRVFPGSSWLMAWKAEALVLSGRPVEGLVASEVIPETSDRLEAQLMAQGALGHRAIAKQLLARYIALNGPSSPVDVAGLLAFQGDLDEAMRWLEKAEASHSPDLSTVKGNLECFPGVRQNARYQALLRRLHLPP